MTPRLASPQFSDYIKITKGTSIPNRQTKVTRMEFESNLISSGFTKTLSKDGKVSIFDNGKTKYTVRDFSSSIGGPTAEIIQNGETTLKIRLER